MFMGGEDRGGFQQGAPLAEFDSYLTEDRQLLHGLLWLPAGKTRTAVIYVPGGPGGFAGPVALNPIASAMTGKGYAFMAVNMRTAGANGFLFAHFEDCVKDIGTAVRFLKSRAFTDIVLVGDSLGGARSVYYWFESREPSIKALVFLATIKSPYLEAQLRWNEKERAEYDAFLREARDRVAKGRGQEILTYPAWYPGRPIVASARTFVNLFGTPEESNASTVKFGAHVTLPSLILHGNRDAVSLPENPESVFQSLTASPRRDLLWVDGEHFLIPEPEAGKYAEALIGWLLEVAPPIQ